MRFGKGAKARCGTGETGIPISPAEAGAAEESRTLDLNLGKVALYQLSYSRIDWLEARTGVEPI